MTDNDRQDLGSRSGGRISPFIALKRPFFQRKRSCPLTALDLDLISYKNPNLLKKFISERGRILPSRLTSVVYRRQGVLAREIKRARFLALLHYTSN